MLFFVQLSSLVLKPKIDQENQTVSIAIPKTPNGQNKRNSIYHKRLTQEKEVQIDRHTTVQIGYIGHVITRAGKSRFSLMSASQLRRFQEELKKGRRRILRRQIVEFRNKLDVRT